MPTSLRNRLNGLASSFAASVLDAIRGTSLEELLAGSSSRGVRDGGRSVARDAVRSAPSGGRRRRGRLPRRSAGDIAHVIEKIVSLLRQHAGGLRAEQIREKLALQAKELPRPLKEALDTGRLSKSGRKRATTYFLKGGGAPSSKGVPRAAGGRRGRRAARKAARAAGRRAKARRTGQAAKRAAGDAKKTSAQVPPSGSPQAS
jgi:hypothetical protein